MRLLCGRQYASCVHAGGLSCFWNIYCAQRLKRKQNVLKDNKKVLLRERKRHITHRVTSTHCAGLVGGGGGYPAVNYQERAVKYMPHSFRLKRKVTALEDIVSAALIAEIYVSL